MILQPCTFHLLIVKLIYRLKIVSKFTPFVNFKFLLKKGKTILGNQAKTL
jgi:hypothetical protein